MALKPVISSLEEVAEPLRQEYKPLGDGRFVLDTDVESHPSLNGLKNSLANAREERNQFKEKAAKFDGIDPTHVQALIEQDRLVKEGKLIAEGKLEEVVALRTQALKDDLSSRLVAKDTENVNLKGQLDKLVIDNAVQVAATALGVRKTAVDDVLARARQTFIVKDGRAVAMENGNIVYGKNGVEPKGIDEWLSELPAKAAHLFEESKGSGAPGGGTPPKAPVGPGVIGRNDTAGFLHNLDKIAKGEIKVQ